MSRVEVVMPKMGESVMEGTITEWNKKVGDEVEVDETLLEIATDKVDTEVPCPDAGVLVEVLADEGDTVEVGETIAVIETDKSKADTSASGEQEAPSTETEEVEEETEESETPEEEPQVAEEKESTPQEPEAEPATASEDAESEPAVTVSGGDTPPQRRGSDGRFYSPLVRSIAREEGISQEELESIEGSGKGGRVSKKDILDYVEKRESGEVDIEAQTGKTEATGDGQAEEESRKEEERAREKADRESISAGELEVERPDQDVEVIKMDRMRKMIAEHMVRSKQTAAHVTTFAEADVTNLVKWREENKEAFKKRTGVKLTFTPLFLEALIQGIREYPLINSSVDGDEILVKKDINFGLAVALGEGGEGGLIVPVIKKAQEKNLEGLAKSVKEVGKKARNKNLDPDDLVGGTITLTNYGSVGNLMGTPIINQPQVAIMGTGVIQKKPVVKETEEGDVIAIRHMMYLSLSYDHRIIDGAHGGAFLNRVKELLEGFDTDRAI